MLSDRVTSAVAVLALFTASCGFFGPRQLVAPGKHLFPASRDCITTDDGGQITCGGERYATLGCRSDRRARCRALWVEYANGVRVWPFAPRGFDTARPERYDPGNPKVDFDQASFVIVARDGSRVWWWHRSGALSSGAFHVFHVLADTLEDVDQADVWQIWALVHEGRAVRLCGDPELWPR